MEVGEKQHVNRKRGEKKSPKEEKIHKKKKEKCHENGLLGKGLMWFQSTQCVVTGLHCFGEVEHHGRMGRQKQRSQIILIINQKNGRKREGQVKRHTPVTCFLQLSSTYYILLFLMAHSVVKLSMN